MDLDGYKGPFHWIELKVTPDKAVEAEAWCRKYSPPTPENIRRMCEDSKKERYQAHIKTRNWQKEAIKHSLPTD